MPLQAFRLVPEKSRRPHKVFQFALVGLRHGLGIRVMAKKLRGNHVHPFVGALGAEYGSRQQLERRAEMQRTGGFRVSLAQDRIDPGRAFAFRLFGFCCHSESTDREPARVKQNFMIILLLPAAAFVTPRKTVPIGTLFGRLGANSVVQPTRWYRCTTLMEIAITLNSFTLT